MNRNLETIVSAYFAALFFTDAGEPEQKLTGEEEIPESERAAVRADVSRFLGMAGPLLGEEWTDEQIGHDLWLTRNGHGAGFWDRRLPNGDALSMIARRMGEVWPGLNDGGQLCDCASPEAYEVQA